MDTEQSKRRDAAIRIANDAAELALKFFRDVSALHIEQKGVQDLVSNADTTVETRIRDELQAAFPDDGIVGEEHGRKASQSGYTWVIDPIDGTANFVRGCPGWCVVLACVKDDEAVLGVIRDPVADEIFIALKGEGATLNGNRLQVSDSKSLDDGSTGVGHSSRINPEHTLGALAGLMNAGGVFYRNASGALMLSYVAAGRLIAYCEPHMYSWDCVAALLLINEAGGDVYPYDMQDMLASGGCVITAGPNVYPQLHAICEEAFEL
ncbi:MAG: inositol monophosphatase [Granulosicoccus sp.]